MADRRKNKSGPGQPPGPRLLVDVASAGSPHFGTALPKGALVSHAPQQRMLLTSHASTRSTLRQARAGFNNKNGPDCEEPVEDANCLWKGTEKKSNSVDLRLIHSSNPWGQERKNPES